MILIDKLKNPTLLTIVIMAVVSQAGAGVAIGLGADKKLTMLACAAVFLGPFLLVLLSEWRKGAREVGQKQKPTISGRGGDESNNVNSSLLVDGRDCVFRGKPYFLEDAIWIGGEGDFRFEFGVPDGGLTSLLERAAKEQVPVDVSHPCGRVSHHSGYSAADMGTWTHPIETLKISVRGSGGVLTLRATGSCGPIDTGTVGGHEVPIRCLNGHCFDLETRLPLERVEGYVAHSPSADQRRKILAAFAEFGKGACRERM